MTDPNDILTNSLDIYTQQTENHLENIITQHATFTTLSQKITNKLDYDQIDTLTNSILRYLYDQINLDKLDNCSAAEFITENQLITFTIILDYIDRQNIINN